MGDNEYWFLTIVLVMGLVGGVFWVWRVPPKKTEEPSYLELSEVREGIVIEEITPMQGLVLGGEQVVIKGKNFPVGSEVLFGETLAGKVERKEGGGELVAETPVATRAGGVKVKVLTPQGQIFESERLYFYLQPK